MPLPLYPLKKKTTKQKSSFIICGLRDSGAVWGSCRDDDGGVDSML